VENSILTSTKKLLGIDAAVTVFDVDVITHINMAFSILDQLGVGPEGGPYAIDEASYLWDDVGLPPSQLQLVRSYIPLRVRLSFDPPTTSFTLDALKQQIQELEVRLNIMREFAKAQEEAAP
jgi:hypothetical protein